MWNAQNASHIHTASTAATGSNPMPNQNSTNNLPDFQFRKVRKKLDTTKTGSLPHRPSPCRRFYSAANKEPEKGRDLRTSRREFCRIAVQNWMICEDSQSIAKRISYSRSEKGPSALPDAPSLVAFEHRVKPVAEQV